MRSFLYTIRQTMDAFSKPIAGTTTKADIIPITKIEALVRIALTFILVYIVMYLFKLDTPQNNYGKIASTILGVLLGYWFR